MGMTTDQRAPIAFQALLGFSGVVAIAPLVSSPLIAQAHLSTQYAVLEILLILVLAVVPVAWRCAVAGIRAVTEPVSLMSIAFIFYYVLRGIMILVRHSIVRPDLILQQFRATDLELAIALAYALAGFCLFHVGYRFWKPPTSIRVTKTAWDKHSLNRAALVGICLAGASTLVLFRVSGGISGVLNQFGCLRMVTVGYGYAFLGLAYWNVLFGFLLWDRLQRGASILLPLGVLVISCFCDAAFGNRTGVMATWATGFMLYVYAVGRQQAWRSAGLLVGLAAAAAGFAVPMAFVRQAGCVALVTGVRPPVLTTSNVKMPPQAATKASSNTEGSPPDPNAGGGATQTGEKSDTKTGPTAITKALASVSARIKSLVTRVSAATQSLSAKVRAVAPKPSDSLRVMNDFVALDSFTAIINAGPSVFPFRYGGTYLDGVLFVVPRRLWPQKPGSFSVAVGRYMLGTENDLPPGFIGELYINFRLAGVLAGSYLLGILLRWAHRWTLSGDPAAVPVYAVLAPYLFMFMGRNFLGGGTLMLIPLGLMIPLIYYLRRPVPTAGERSVPFT